MAFDSYKKSTPYGRLGIGMTPAYADMMLQGANKRAYGRRVRNIGLVSMKNSMFKRLKKDLSLKKKAARTAKFNPLDDRTKLWNAAVNIVAERKTDFSQNQIKELQKMIGEK